MANIIYRIRRSLGLLSTEEIIREQLEAGKALKDGFEEGIKGLREESNVLAEKIRETLIPPMEE